MHTAFIVAKKESLGSVATFQNFMETYEKGLQDALCAHIFHIHHVIDEEPTA